MASNYTTNYQLPKWEKTDRVQMKDFNDMTATLDEALHGLAVSAEAAQAAVDSEAAARAAAITALENKSRFTKLKEFTSTEASSFMQIYLNDIDWAKWDKVHIDIDSAKSGSYFFYTTDAATAGEHIGSLSCSAASGLLSPRITFEVGFRADRMVVARCASNVCSLNCSFAQLVKMAFSGSVLSAGAHYVFWGEK